MKKMLLILVGIVLAGTLTGCQTGSKKGDTTQNESTSPAQSSVSTETIAKLDYPTKPVNLVVGFGTGGSPDNAARAFAQVASKYMNAQVVVMNKPGSAGSLAHSYVKGEAADGHALILTGNSPSEVVSPPGTFNFDSFEDFEFIGRLNSNRGVLAVRPDAPYRTFEELIDYSKAHPNEVKVSTAGVNGLQDLVVSLINRAKGTSLVPVAFDSSSAGLAAVLGKHVDVYVGSGRTALPQVEAGALVPLVSVYSDTNDPNYPDLKILSEYGVEDVADQFGIGVKKGTPQEIVDHLDEVIQKVINDPEYLEVVGKLGLTIDYLGPKDFTQFTKELYDLERELSAVNR